MDHYPAARQNRPTHLLLHPAKSNATDTGANLGLTADVSLWHSFGQGFNGTLDLHYTRQRQRLRPFFAGCENISAAAGISGNSQAPRDWGPPDLQFSSGTAPLADAAARDNRDQTTELSWDARWLHGKHDVEFGAAFRRLEFNLLQQSNARGALVFNGAATGNDLQDFLLGLPDAAQLAFGNADKYFRESAGDGFVTDNWQATGSLSLDLGVRWDYSGPVGERYGRLVNLAVAPAFASATPVVGRGAVVKPDVAGLQPRLGLAWRPFGLADFVLRAGYGVYFDSSPYEMIAQRMAQQAPLSKSLQVASTPAAPLSFANAFASATGAGMTTFAVDPEFRQGYVQIWNASVEAGLPGDMALTASYQGNRGAHGMQEFLPNTVPPGAAAACAACPVGFTYLDSNGRSAYQSGTLELQRRLSDGLLALLSYTYSKNMDNSAPGGSTPALAQNWRDLDAEWAPADTDQRNRATAAVQYSTGLERWSQRLPHAWERNVYRGWTLATQLTAVSGQPLMPVTSLLVPGTGVGGSVRPDVTGVAVGAAPPGRFVNPAAYAPPTPGVWGTAGRNSIRGPSQFDLDASLARSFKLPVLGHGLDTLFRLDATNALNHVRYTSFDTTFGSTLFGLPTSTQPMRKLLATLRIRF